ncbi:hypothetical protein KEK_06942 [Mycolicibacterium thermoresistibile ATCC 19527]|uniref:Uncharacterized protein n=1 Tax=Mycolicibacterium thermoresistibile (strain ATCC 19527 / DSM 44167 / CIP 105390 / JCM 6362 / NCTC 10409 / 316) TaxID=1078020 RepID=G7CEH4_MYCT3|nr:hypothetical protein [Mycolicibacterium thermoresistibile]EHI13616.1 hypothetical protein KEK_06942 [Mycolicibacterium thermoresistibile ATCC 19527]SNW19365.1 Uncharacterised protein [Mycolicibacterium thermoresistibile]
MKPLTARSSADRTTGLSLVSTVIVAPAFSSPASIVVTASVVEHFTVCTVSTSAPSSAISAVPDGSVPAARSGAAVVEQADSAAAILKAIARTVRFDITPRFDSDLN